MRPYLALSNMTFFTSKSFNISVFNSKKVHVTFLSLKCHVLFEWPLTCIFPLDFVAKTERVCSRRRNSPLVCQVRSSEQTCSPQKSWIDLGFRISDPDRRRSLGYNDCPECKVASQLYCDFPDWKRDS